MVDLGGVGFERVGAELLDADADGLVDALRDEVVEPPWEFAVAVEAPLLLVTSVGVLAMVERGPEKTAMRGLLIRVAS